MASAVKAVLDSAQKADVAKVFECDADGPCSSSTNLGTQFEEFQDTNLDEDNDYAFK